MRTPRNPLISIAALCVFAAACLYATTSVTVSSGDTLSQIAEDHGVSVADLVAWNSLDDPDRIVVGQILTLDGEDHRGGGAAQHHVVTAGETLSIIAARYGASVAALVDANQIADPDVIRAGQSLTIGAAPAQSGPEREDGQESDAREEPQVTDGAATSHPIQPGETLFAIARRYGVTVDAIAEANQLGDADRIRSGTILSIPSASTTPTEAADQAAPDPDSDSDSDSDSEPPPEADPEPASEPTPDPEPTVEAEPTPESDPEPRPVDEPTTTHAPGAAGPLAAAFDLWSLSYGVPQDLVEAITWHASDWQPAITSPDGRLGIGQLTPEQIELVETRLLGLSLDPFDASDGIRLTARYLRYLRDRTDDDHTALVAYHQGLTSLLEDGPTAAGLTFADAVLAIRDQRR